MANESYQKMLRTMQDVEPTAGKAKTTVIHSEQSAVNGESIDYTDALLDALVRKGDPNLTPYS